MRSRTPAPKGRRSGRLLAVGLVALALTGATSTAAMAAHAREDEEFVGGYHERYSLAEADLPELREYCRNGWKGRGKATVIRYWVNEYPNFNPRRYQAIVLCQEN